MDTVNVRWAFNADAWQPSYEEILSASSYIQTEEKKRISKFVFQNDAKSSLIGRLMLRKFVHFATSMPYDEIEFGRDLHGKPFLLGTANTSLSFNVSHQSAYVVLAGSATHKIGIDVMKIEPPAGKNVPEFFRLMTRQFSTHEWSTVKNFPTEKEQIACFYRLWCLKESYVKNTGFGLTVPLNEISFQVKTRDLEVGKFVTDTTLIEKNVLKKDWFFEETLLDEKYAIAVSLQMKDQSKYEPVPYRFMTFEELVEGAKPLREPDSNFSVDFMNKEVKHF